MLLLAQMKISPGFSELDAYDDLAVLAQRFGLDVSLDHKDAITFIEEAIAKRSRICLKPSDRNRMWIFTSYPSEPFLSCAAAQMLHESPEDRRRILKTLMANVESGLIREAGKRGGLANRLLWLIAKDLFVRETLKVPFLPLPNWQEPSPESELADCKRIPVVGYLEFVFGESFWSTVAPGVEPLFAKAYINFSHWITMKSLIWKRDGIRRVQLTLSTAEINGR